MRCFPVAAVPKGVSTAERINHVGLAVEIMRTISVINVYLRPDVWCPPPAL